MKRNIKDTSKNDRKFRKREELYQWSVIEMKEYLAHIRRDESAVQTIRAHLLRVGDLMASYAEKMELSATARLIGVLHDLGKCSREFAPQAPGRLQPQGSGRPLIGGRAAASEEIQCLGRG